jgi:hypothetical protein
VLGTGRSSSFSYLVGYGRLSPARPQHRLSSCGSSDSCNVVTGLMAQGRNPVQLKGRVMSEDDSIYRASSKHVALCVGWAATQSSD